MSVKFRITAWFTVMILILMVLVVSIVFMVEDESLTEDPASELIRVVSMNATMLSDKHNDDDKDKLKNYDDGVYCMFYDADGNIVTGAMPETILYDKFFENGNLATYEGAEGAYYVYDMKVVNADDIVWIRGFISTTEPSHLMKTIIILMCILLPVILVFSVSGGWLIAKHSMKPIDTMIEAVDSIKEGKDLSARVNMHKGPSEIRKLSEEFDNMFERLEKSFVAEKQFASDVSHELRTPITIVLGECHRVKRKELISDEFRDAVDIIEKQSQHMSELVEQLLSLTRLQQGTDRFPLNNLNLSDFVEACIEDFMTGIDSAKIVEMNVEKNVYANFNAALMSRVIFNLMDNARKYTDDNGIIKVRLTLCQKHAELTIEDNGVGIAEENLPNIWNRFWQADMSRGIDGGVGLGLAMVKEMVEFQGGNISVNSKTGQGTIFNIYLD